MFQKPKGSALFPLDSGPGLTSNNLEFPHPPQQPLMASRELEVLATRGRAAPAPLVGGGLDAGGNEGVGGASVGKHEGDGGGGSIQGFLNEALSLTGWIYGPGQEWAWGQWVGGERDNKIQAPLENSQGKAWYTCQKFP